MPLTRLYGQITYYSRITSSFGGDFSAGRVVSHAGADIGMPPPACNTLDRSPFWLAPHAKLSEHLFKPATRKGRRGFQVGVAGAAGQMFGAGVARCLNVAARCRHGMQSRAEQRALADLQSFEPTWQSSHIPAQAG